MIYVFLGTTAELIKMIPIIREFQARKVKYRIVLSGQTEVNFAEFQEFIGEQEIYFSFEGKINKSSPVNFFIWTVKTLVSSLFWAWKEFSEKKKDILIIVHGDTVTTVIGAMIAKAFGLKLAHVEAGARSFDFLEPFPEELSRNIVDYFADLNFCSNQWASGNIRNRRGIRIDTKWNTAVEAFSLALKSKIKSILLSKIKRFPFFILFMHRQEHLFIRKEETIKLIDLILKEIEKQKLKCLFIIPGATKNYLLKNRLWEKIVKNPKIITTPSLPFREFVQILVRSEFIITDGGGNQSECFLLGKPCLLLRKKTEQVEGLGENVVLSREDATIIRDFFRDYKKYKWPEKKVMTMPSKIIVDELLENY